MSDIAGQFRSVIEHHLRIAIDLMKVTGEGPDPTIWYDLAPFIPPDPRPKDPSGLSDHH